MIKFFRRIRQNLINEGKTTKYFKYAIGEIILVVIGILIALQINNWNETRKNQAKEKSILKAIHQEFKRNKSQLDTIIFYDKRVLNSTEKLIAQFPIDIEKVNLDSISMYLAFMFKNYTFNPSQGSINSIINTSSFDIIQNDSLRDLLISWPDLVTDFQEDELNGSLVINNFMDPYFSKHFEFDFNFNDSRNNLKALETLEFEYIINLRKVALESILGELGELEKLTKSLDDIIRLSQVSE